MLLERQCQDVSFIETPKNKARRRTRARDDDRVEGSSVQVFGGPLDVPDGDIGALPQEGGLLTPRQNQTSIAPIQCSVRIQAVVAFEDRHP